MLLALNSIEEKKITGAEARDIIAASDTNNDGGIDFSEFVTVRCFIFSWRMYLICIAQVVSQHRQKKGGGADFVGAVKANKEVHVNKMAGYSQTAGKAIPVILHVLIDL